MSGERVGVPSVTAAEAVDGGFVVVDVRSPREYAQGHAPGALNLPLLDDGQRHQVGLAYHKRGAQQARMAALDLVSAGLPGYLRALAVLARGDRRVAVMCWRGGERSRNVVLLLTLVGVHAVRVEGGYKAYRRWVLDGLSAWRPDRPVFTLFGQTGAGKTALLRALAAVAGDLPRPRPEAIDLEGMALHRGSLLGGLYQPGQRTQKDFDSLVWHRLRAPRGDYLVVEGEGAKIGRVFLPESVAALVREGIPVLVSAPREERTQRLLSEYAPEAWSPADQDRFRRSLALIGERLPPEEHASLRQAFEDDRFSDVVERLLSAYYDPLYQRSSVEGRAFALALITGPDPEADALRLAAELGRMVESAR